MGLKQAQGRLRGIEQEKVRQFAVFEAGFMQCNHAATKQLRPRHPLQGTQQGFVVHARAQVQQHGPGLEDLVVPCDNGQERPGRL